MQLIIQSVSTIDCRKRWSNYHVTGSKRQKWELDCSLLPGKSALCRRCWKVESSRSYDWEDSLNSSCSTCCAATLHQETPVVQIALLFHRYQRRRCGQIPPAAAAMAFREVCLLLLSLLAYTYAEHVKFSDCGTFLAFTIQFTRGSYCSYFVMCLVGDGHREVRSSATQRKPDQKVVVKCEQVVKSPVKWVKCGPWVGGSRYNVATLAPVDRPSLKNRCLFFLVMPSRPRPPRGQ